MPQSDKISYQSFCWSFGTTSFRTKDFNREMELQLALLKEFWKKNESKKWDGSTQKEYYDFLKEHNFLDKEAPNKDKDARQKTSGLVDLGLLTNDRKLTKAGEKLLLLSQTNDFASDNFLQIPKDSFIYLKQLLKTCDDNFKVRPFVVLLHLLDKFEYLSYDEFKYLLPLCTDADKIALVERQIIAQRSGESTTDAFILDILMQMDNYRAALKLFLKSEVKLSVFLEIGMNRKSGKYDAPYFGLYKALKAVFLKGDLSENALNDLLKAIKKLRLRIWWKRYIFGSNSDVKILKTPTLAIQETIFSDAKDETSFKIAFFKTMHLFKAKATLSDYFDLNRRYVKISDVIIFSDEKVTLDLLPKYFFKGAISELYKIAFSSTNLLFEDCDLNQISPALKFDEKLIIKSANSDLNLNITSISALNDKAEEERYKRFNTLIETKFSDDILFELLEYFQNRNDEKINEIVTNNADIPTIFEYILGIIWYKISDKKGKILDFMNLSLEADLLPKTHASGGEADIIYRYESTAEYPKHELLIEATLSEKNNQRRMEMEPVSRHLGDRLLASGNLNSYCVFISNFVHNNVVSDFKSRRDMPYYSLDGEKQINGMNIAPLEIDEIKAILKNQTKYETLYKIFSRAFNSNLKPLEWRETCIKKPILEAK